MSNNNLSEMNGQILHDNAEHNVWVESIAVDGNEQVKANHVSNIKRECMLNIQIKEFILPKLQKASETGFQHKSVGHNCYADYDVTELSFEKASFFKLDFVAKFMVQNKESFEKLILKNVHIEARGIALTNVLKDKAYRIDLQVIYIEDVNLSEKGLKQLIV